MEEMLEAVFFVGSVPSAVRSNVTENTGPCVVVSWETDASQLGRKLRSRCQAVPSEDTADWEDLVRAVVNCKVCESAIVL
jgi:hypothetical protein